MILIHQRSIVKNNKTTHVITSGDKTIKSFIDNHPLITNLFLRGFEIEGTKTGLLEEIIIIF